MGVLIVLHAPTKGMVDAANKAGNYSWPVNGQAFPKIQVVTVNDLLNGQRVNMPTPLRPYMPAPKTVTVPDQQRLTNGNGT